MAGFKGTPRRKHHEGETQEAVSPLQTQGTQETQKFLDELPKPAPTPTQEAPKPAQASTAPKELAPRRSAGSTRVAGAKHLAASKKSANAPRQGLRKNISNSAAGQQVSKWGKTLSDKFYKVDEKQASSQNTEAYAKQKGKKAQGQTAQESQDASTFEALKAKAGDLGKNLGSKAASAGAQVVEAFSFDPKKVGNFFRRYGRAMAITLALILIFVLAVYMPAKNFYIAKRAQERLQVEYQQNIEHNAALQERVESLQTDAGVEDEARKNMGLVMPGEHSIKIVGASQAVRPKDENIKRIEKGSGRAEVHWWTRLLDFVFGLDDTEFDPQYKKMQEQKAKGETE